MTNDISQGLKKRKVLIIVKKEGIIVEFTVSKVIDVSYPR